VDVMMIITAQSVKTYDAITASMMTENPLITRINTHVVLDALKLGLYVPVD
jgi:hypothetical protein